MIFLFWVFWIFINLTLLWKNKMDDEKNAKKPKDLSYRSYLFMLRISEEGALILNTKKELILKELLKMFKDLWLNELEISLLAIYLERFGWESRSSLEILVLFSAYTAKCYLNENLSGLETNLLQKYSFFQEYSKWIGKYRNNIPVAYVELNYIYTKLIKADITAEEVNCYDYNFAVTQLIENTTKPEKIDS